MHTKLCSIRAFSIPIVSVNNLELENPRSRVWYSLSLIIRLLQSYLRVLQGNLLIQRIQPNPIFLLISIL